MPIIIVIDVSLSMLAPFEGIVVPSTASANCNDSNSPTRRSAAIAGVLSFLDHLEAQNRHEFVTLASFSEDLETTEFTRDYALLKNQLLLKPPNTTYDVRTKTNVIDTLRGVFSRCISVWGSSNVLCHVVMLTDCAGYDRAFESLVNAAAISQGKQPIVPIWTYGGDTSSSSLEPNYSPHLLVQEFRNLTERGQFSVHVICVNKPAATTSAATTVNASSSKMIFHGRNAAANANNANTNNDDDRVLQHNVRLFRRLVECFVGDETNTNSGGGGNNNSFRFVDVTSPTSWILTFRELADELSTPTTGRLRCGSMCSAVHAVPALRPVRRECDFDLIIGEPSSDSSEITIMGFLKPAELGSPPVASRHLILPVVVKGNSNEEENVMPQNNRSSSSSSIIATTDDFSPNFCVLLHGAMKTEDMVAICEIGPSWYGYIHHVQNAKRSNLILHCFEPGVDAVPWLGPLNKLVLRPVSASAGSKSPFPVVPAIPKPSYAMNNPNWIHSYGLQTDLQKVLRYARKLPEKEIQFYQELNRVCNQASSLGFVDLYLTLARTFEREIVTAGVNSPQSATLQKAIDILVSGRLKHGDPISQFAR